MMNTKRMMSLFHEQLDDLARQVINRHMESKQGVIYEELHKHGLKMVECFKDETISTEQEFLKMFVMMEIFFKEYRVAMYDIVSRYNKKKALSLLEILNDKYINSLVSLQSSLYYKDIK